MSRKTLLEIRTNSNFAVKYDDLTLVPELELIMIFQEPEYQIKKSSVVKAATIKEFRINTNAEGVGQMIGQLQALQNQLLTFTNLSEMLNTVIKNSTTPKEKI